MVNQPGKHHWRTLIGVVVFMLTILGMAAKPYFVSAVTALEAFEPTPCPAEWTYPPNYRVTCGFILAPENHNKPDGGKIKLMAALVHSRSPNPKPDPVIFIAGGPGAPGLEAAQMAQMSFAAVLETRDMIFFDQRGVGSSQPALSCPMASEPITQARLNLVNGSSSLSDYQTTVKQVIATCRDHFHGQNIDLNQYTTAQSAADIPYIGHALGYKTWNLYGVSYGGNYALAVARYQPAGIRSIILDSALPPQVDVFTDGLPNTFAALAAFFAECKTNWRCRTFYPNLEPVYHSLFDQLNETPIEVRPTVSELNQTLSVKVNGTLFASLVKQSLYVPDTRNNLPRLIYDTYNGDYEYLTDIVLQPIYFHPAANVGLTLSAVCSEEIPFADLAARQQLIANQPAAISASILDIVDFMVPACQGWVEIPTDPTVNTPVQSTLPVLILSGALDGLTAIPWADLIAETLPNSFLYIFPSAGHGVLLEGICPGTVTGFFLDDPTSPPQANCISKMERGTFTISKTVVWLPAVFTASILGGLACLVIIWVVLSLKLREFLPAIKTSLRMQGWAAWIVPLGIIAFVLLLDGTTSYLDRFPYLKAHNIIATIIPLSIGLQAALLFAPSQEPAIEILLLGKRPLPWILIERLGVVFITQAILATIMMGVANMVSPDNTLTGQAFLAWIGSACLLAGIGIFTTLTTRKSIIGASLVMVIWFAFAPNSTFLLDRWPFAWPFTLYPPANVLDADFLLLNRLIMLILGTLFFGLGIFQLRGPEILLIENTSKPKLRQQTSNSRSKINFNTPLAGIIRYELLMQVRQRYILLIFGTMTGILFLIGIQGRSQLAGELSAMAATGNVLLQKETITNWAIQPIIAISMILAIVLPGFVSDAIPKDTDYKTDELINSLPLKPHLYLQAKLFSVWIIISAGVLFMFITASLGLRLLFGPIDVGRLLEVFLLIAMPLVLYTSGMSVLIASSQKSRRSAVLVGIGFAVLYGIVIPLTVNNTIRDALLANPFIFLVYYLDEIGALIYTQQDLHIAIGSMFVQICIVWSGLSLWKFKT